MQKLTIRLEETTSPPGEIMLADLAAIVRPLQEVSTRVARWVADIDRSGRGPRHVEDAALLRLTGLRSGSTVLEIDHGPTGRFSFDMPIEQAFEDRFWSVIAGIESDAPPIAAPTRVRESVVELLDALQRAAGRVEMARSDGARVCFRPASRNRAAWMPSMAEDAGDITVAGTLEMVDLRSRRFRVRDDVGHTITLEDVVEPAATARLIGQAVTASGRQKSRPGGLLLAKAVVAPAPPLLGTDNWPVSLGKALAEELSKPGPDPAGAVELTDDEFADFLATMRDV